MSRIDEIKKRLAETTPGQWYVNYLDDDHHMNLVAVTTRPDTGKHEALPYDDESKEIRDSIVATTLVQADFEPTQPYVRVDVDEFDSLDFSKGCKWDEDAEFIANAKDDIQFLLDEVERLNKQIEKGL